MILSINSGFYNTKIMTDSGDKICIPSRVQLNIDAEQSIVYDGKVYEVGDGVRSLTDKFDSLCHKLMTKYSILKYGGNKTNLMVALPIALYLNKDYRDRYGKSLVGKHKGIVDGEEKEVTVLDCTVLAEGACSYLANKELLHDKLVGVLDFGGNTVIGVIYDNGNIIRESICQMDLGTIKLERRLLDAINIEKGWALQDYELLDVLKKQECPHVINAIMIKHTDDIKENLLQKKWHIGRLDLFATGGGSRFLKPYLMNQLDNVTLSNNPLYDTVVGLHEAGRVIYNA